MDAWDAENGYPQQSLSEKQTADRRALLRIAGPLSRKVRRYDIWISKDIDFALTEQFMQLEAKKDRAYREKDAQYPADVSVSVIKVRIDDPEYQRLSDAASNADAALREFKKRHDM